MAGTVGLLLAALPALAKTPPKTEPKPAPMQTAIIENTGSTNTLGYKITVMLTKTNYLVTSLSNGGKDRDVRKGGVESFFPGAQQLFADLEKAMPLNTLPVRHGMRSASFGTQTYITYKGQRSPDLSFASDPRTISLKADIDQITKELHVGNASRRPIVIHSDR